jgi:hypothetical protein
MKTLLLILLILSSCGSAQKKAPVSAPIGSEVLFSYVAHTEHSYSVYGLSNGLINGAMQAWNDALGRNILTRTPGSFPITIQWAEDLTEVRDTPLASAYAKRFLDRCEVYMKVIPNTARYGYDELGVLTHELGHCIGFDHSSNEKSIMYYKVGEDASITTEQIRIINQLGSN